MKIERCCFAAKTAIVGTLISWCVLLPSKGDFAQATAQNSSPVSDLSTYKQGVAQSHKRDSAADAGIAHMTTGQKVSVQISEVQPEQERSEDQSAVASNQTPTTDQKSFEIGRNKEMSNTDTATEIRYERGLK